MSVVTPTILDFTKIKEKFPIVISEGTGGRKSATTFSLVAKNPECDPKEWVENPVVFRLKHLKRDISLKFYSRLREINKESSFSVLG